jgi:para-nitrobenzyl esterase
MNARVRIIAIGTLISVALAPAAFAQQAPPASEVGASQLAILNLPGRNGVTLAVTSPAFTSHGDIPFENTQYRGNIFPGLAWTAGPSGTMSYVVIVQDADAMARGAPIFHWSMLNIPAAVTSLPAAMSAPPAGAEYGPNIRGASQAYMGPHTPPGPKHRYHFQIFALDTSISGEAPATYAALTDAMKGHVLASGELVGLGQAPPPAAH